MAAILLVLVGGALVNIAVAWLCAVRDDGLGQQRTMHLGVSFDTSRAIGEWRVSTVIRLGSTPYWSERPRDHRG